LRYLVSGLMQQLASGAQFPIGTVVVNLAGCFIIGFLSQLAEARGVFTSETRAFVFIGLLGGFTTFSTFSNETMNFLRDGQTASALINIGTQVIFGLGAVWLGRTFAYMIWR
jgi:fluoride exporter